MDIATNSADPLAHSSQPGLAAPAKPGAVDSSLITGTLFERRKVMSAAVDIVTPEQIIEHLIGAVRTRTGCAVTGISAPYATAMADDPALRDAFLAADILVPDGKGFVWGARMLGVKCGERIAIPDLCETLLAAGANPEYAVGAVKRSWKVFIYGGTEEINRAACENVRTRFPGLSCVSGQHGYNQGLAEENAVIQRLKDEEFNLLIVARPSPDKELFMARCCRESGVVGLAAGGYADILAGKTTRAPGFVQALGLEWLYRIVQEPRRLWKRIGWANLRFASAAAWSHLRMPAARPWWGCPSIHVLATILVICAAYGGSLNLPYHFDDPEYIERNPTIRSFSALADIKVMAFRKLWWISNAICYKLSELYGSHQVEKPDVRIFRVWNIGCHLIASLALFGLVRRALKSSQALARLADPKRLLPAALTEDGGPHALAAALAAAIFAAHPLCTESVTYISGRDNSQGGMFYLLGLYAACIAFDRISFPGESIQPGNDTVPLPRWPAAFWPLIAAVLMGACAVLTKESYLTFPGAVVLLYLFFYRGLRVQTVSTGLLIGLLAGLGSLAWGAAGRHDGYLAISIQLALLFITAGALLGAPSNTNMPHTSRIRAGLQHRIAMGWALILSGAGLGAVSVVAFPYAYQRTIGALTGYQNSNYIRSLCSQAYAVPWMLLRTVVPYGLSIDHEFPSISDIGDQRVINGAVIIGALVLFGLIGMRRRWLGGFGVLLALLAIAPSNSVIERGDIVSERNFYLAAAGGSLILAWFVAEVTSTIALWLAARTPGNPAASRGAIFEAGLWTAALGCCVAGPFASFTVLRNHQWSDPYLLWESAWERSPERLRVLYNYGVAAYARKHYSEAQMAFENAVKIGESKAEKGQFRADEAVQVKCFHLAYAYMASVLLRGDRQQSQTEYENTLRHVDKIFSDGIERTAYDPDLVFSYGQLLMQMNRAPDACKIMQQSLDLHPWAEQLYYPLGIGYLEIGNFGLSKQNFSQALQVQEHHTSGVSWDMPATQKAQHYAYLGVTNIWLKERNEARENFRKALDLDHQAVLVMLLTCLRARNADLKPLEIDPPDMLLTGLSQTRRDLIQSLVLAIDDHLKAHPDKEKSVVSMLKGILEQELKRRAIVQDKREKAGFTDDPDRDK